MYVRLTVGDPPNKPLVWYVAAVVVREDGRPVVDDVLYLTGKDGEVESRLSKDLSAGCDGARWVSISLFLTLLGYGQVPQQDRRIGFPIQAEIPVRGLYRQLVSHPIVGIPTPKRMEVLSPYLSSSLIHRINQARACRDDWFRLHPKNGEKAPSTWFEVGLFSGYNDRGDPRAFRIDKTESEEDDGSFRVYVRLTEGPQEKPWNLAGCSRSNFGSWKICNQ